MSTKPQSSPPGWTAFFKSIASASGDLSSLQAPAFILSDFSIIEFTSYWSESTKFLAILGGKTEEERHILVLEWYLSTFLAQFTARELKTGMEKKPFNPILGELLIGTMDDGKLDHVAEQVSHHPPISAYTLTDKNNKITLAGHCGQKTSFSSGSIQVKQTGHSILTVNLGAEEQYLITFPKLLIQGLVFGAPYVELGEKSFIQSSTGLLSTIEYKGKGYFSGKAHTFIANITGPASTPLYTIEGQWTKNSTFTAIAPAAKNSTGKKVGDLFLECDKIPRQEIVVKPFEEQGENETRKLWRDVAEGIRSQDFNKAQQAKVKIESEQREKRKAELASGIPFETKLFTKIPNDPVYKKLASMAGLKPENEDSYQLISQ